MATEKSLFVFRYMDDAEMAFCLRCNRACERRAVEHLFVLASRLGDGVFWYLLMLALPVWYGRAALPVSLRMALTGAIGVAVYKLLKSTLIRQRPYLRHGAIQLGTAPLDRCSFPSGHTLHAVSFTTIALWSFSELAWLLIPFALLVAMSRVVLGLRYPSDVLAGATLGLLLALLACAW